MTRLQGPPVAPLPPPLQGQSPTPLFIVFHRFCVLCGAGTGNLSSQPSQPVYGSHTRIVSFLPGSPFCTQKGNRKRKDCRVQVFVPIRQCRCGLRCVGIRPHRALSSAHRSWISRGPIFRRRSSGTTWGSGFCWTYTLLSLPPQKRACAPPHCQFLLCYSTALDKTEVHVLLESVHDLGRATLGKQSVSIFNVSPNVPKFFYKENRINFDPAVPSGDNQNW